MSAPCEYVEKCPIRNYFEHEDWQMMLDRYCYGKYQRCGRHQLREAGEPVPELMMPWDGSTEIISGIEK